MLADGASCAVASLWSRRLTFVSIATGAPGDKHGPCVHRRARAAVLPARAGQVGDGSKLVVADAFGGRLAVVDAGRRAIESVRSIPGHNIRGMAFAPDGKSLVIAHQYLDHLAQTTFDDVHWGLLVRNQLRVVANRRVAEGRI